MLAGVELTFSGHTVITQLLSESIRAIVGTDGQEDDGLVGQPFAEAELAFRATTAFRTDYEYDAKAVRDVSATTASQILSARD
jgi:hypothetical protein